MLDDFNFYENREKSLKAKRSSKLAPQTGIHKKHVVPVSFSVFTEIFSKQCCSYTFIFSTLFQTFWKSLFSWFICLPFAWHCVLTFCRIIKKQEKELSEDLILTTIYLTHLSSISPKISHLVQHHCKAVPLWIEEKTRYLYSHFIGDTIPTM